MPDVVIVRCPLCETVQKKRFLPEGSRTRVCENCCEVIMVNGRLLSKKAAIKMMEIKENAASKF